MDTKKLFQMNYKRESAVDLVINNIKQLLLEGKLKPGDRLPSELELSEGFGVSRGSIREAMKILSAFGLIDIRVGNGTYICEAPSDSLMDSVLFTFFVTNPNVENLYELRYMIEVDVMELILKHYDQNETERIELKNNVASLEILMKNKPSAAQLTESEFSFHRIMGQCTKNPLLARIYDVILKFIAASVSSTHQNQNGEYIYKNHKAIIDLIDQKDYAKIQPVIKASVQTWVDLIGQ